VEADAHILRTPRVCPCLDRARIATTADEGAYTGGACRRPRGTRSGVIQRKPTRSANGGSVEGLPDEQGLQCPRSRGDGRVAHMALRQVRLRSCRRRVGSGSRGSVMDNPAGIVRPARQAGSGTAGQPRGRILVRADANPSRLSRAAESAGGLSPEGRPWSVAGGAFQPETEAGSIESSGRAARQAARSFRRLHRQGAGRESCHPLRT
jgi:hypothetical protein